MTKPTPAALHSTERQAMKSNVTGKEYAISVALPYTYNPDGLKGGPFSRTLPAWSVVYLTDANWHMGMTTEFVREMAWCGRTLDAIVIGIGYPEVDSPQENWRNVSEWRADDLTPVQSDEGEKADSEWLNRPVKSGGGANFLAFLKQELIPWVEQNYRADPEKRVLVGHSYGGSFALYAMFQEPGLFRSYLAASPYIGPSGWLDRIESEYAAKHSDLAAQLYLAAGALEDSETDTTVADAARFASVLASRNFKSLSVTNQVFPDENHCEAVAPALHSGLKIALKRAAK